MAEVEEIHCSVKTQRNRKPNFSVAEEEMLQHEVGKHFEILNRKFSNTTTNHQKKAIWARITDKINALGVAIRTASEVRDKWRNTTSKANSVFTIHRAELQKTGGGPAPKAPSSQLESVIALYQNSASFKGIDFGLETDVLQTAISWRPVLVVAEARVPADNHRVDHGQSTETAINEASLPKEADRGHSQDIFTSPVPTSVQQQPSTRTVEKSVSRPITKRKQATQEDAYELQCQVLKGQLEEQKLTKEKTILQIELIKQLSQDQGMVF